MSFIDMFAAALGAIESDAIKVNDERCISVRNRNAHCMRCAEACTSGCISVEENRLVVQPEKCISCGTCATACPTSAIEICQPNDDDLTHMVKDSIIATKGHPVICCENAVREASLKLEDAAEVAVVLPCLGRVDESLLVGLAAYKAFDVTLVCGNCEQCDRATGGALVRRVAQGAQNMIAAFGSNTTLTVTSDMPASVTAAHAGKVAAAHAGAAGGVSRRSFLCGAKDEGTKAATAAVTAEVADQLGIPEDIEVPAAYRKVNKNGTLSHYVPSRRTRLYNYLRHVGDGTPKGKEVESRIIGAVEIDGSTCKNCRMCAVFCPTGALERVDEGAGGVFGLIHRPAACMQCRLCESICPVQAIHVNATVPMEQFMGREAVVFPMQRPEWKPNTPTSMYDKIHEVIGANVNMSSF